MSMNLTRSELLALAEAFGYELALRPNTCREGRPPRGVRRLVAGIEGVHVLLAELPTTDPDAWDGLALKVADQTEGES